MGYDPEQLWTSQELTDLCDFSWDTNATGRDVLIVLYVSGYDEMESVGEIGCQNE